MFFYIFHSFFCYNMNLYFGPAAIHYIINNILLKRVNIEIGYTFTKRVPGNKIGEYVHLWNSLNRLTIHVFCLILYFNV